VSNLSPTPRFRFLCCRVAIVVVSIFLADSSFAQSVEVDRAQLLRSQTESPFVPTISPNGVDDGRAAASPNDADLGEQEILKGAEQYRAFTASVAAPFYYTSNVALARRGEVSDFLVAPAAGLFYQPRITRTLYGLVLERSRPTLRCNFIQRAAMERSISSRTSRLAEPVRRSLPPIP
jgi:hypothetical protein